MRAMLGKLLLTMCLVAVLKLAFKQALLSGRIYELPEQTDPALRQALAGRLPVETDFTEYQHPLSDEQ